MPSNPESKVAIHSISLFSITAGWTASRAECPDVPTNKVGRAIRVCHSDSQDYGTNFNEEVIDLPSEIQPA